MKDWVYESYNKKPVRGEEVLCDLGKDRNFMVLIYNDGIFYDTYMEKSYYFGKDVKRWCSIGKHFDEQF